MTCEPAYDDHHPLSYYQSLWGNLTCIKDGCPNKGLSFGQIVKKQIKVHFCKGCKERDGKQTCNYVICDICMEKELEKEIGHGSKNRRSKRRRV